MKNQNKKALHVKRSTLNVPPGSSQVIELEGEEVAVFNVKGRLYGIANRCPHRGGPLSRGKLEGKAVRCPLHGYLFDLKSGRCLNQPDTETCIYNVSKIGTKYQTPATKPSAGRRKSVLARPGLRPNGRAGGTHSESK